jgi:hypothetical protein
MCVTGRNPEVARERLSEGRRTFFGKTIFRNKFICHPVMFLLPVFHLTMLAAVMAI